LLELYLNRATPKQFRTCSLNIEKRFEDFIFDFLDLGEKSQRIPKWVAVALFTERFAQVQEFDNREVIRILILQRVSVRFVTTMTVAVLGFAVIIIMLMTFSLNLLSKNYFFDSKSVTRLWN